MIEVTNEMVDLALDVFHDDGMAKALAAVLAIVERDYERRRCDDPSFVGHRCTKPQGHPDSHYHRFSGAVWP